MAYCQHAYQRQFVHPRNLCCARVRRTRENRAACGVFRHAVFGAFLDGLGAVRFAVRHGGDGVAHSGATVLRFAASAAPPALGDVSAGVLAAWEPVALIGSFGLVPAGLARGLFFAVRIVLLVVASLTVTYTTTSTELTDALGFFLRPLKRLGVPTDDIAMVFSLALRFIPVTAEEFGRVHDAQWARGASFAEGSLWERLRAWQTVLIPLFVGLFRRADSLAVAMDARCYGAPDVERTSLAPRAFSGRSGLVLAVGLLACIGLAVWL